MSLKLFRPMTSFRTSPAPIRPSVRRAISRCSCRPTSPTASAIISSVVPRNDPALVDSVARRFGFLPADQIRLQVAEGRRAQLPVGDCRLGRTPAQRVRRAAAGGDTEADPDHGRSIPAARSPSRSCWRFIGEDGGGRSSVIAPRSWPGANRCSILLLEYPACELPFHAYLEMLVAAGAALLFDLVLAIGGPGAMQHHGRRGRRAGRLRARCLQGHLLELSLRPACGRCGLCHRARDQGRLPAPG